MKHILQKLLSAALAAVFSVSPLTAYASDALGHDLAAKTAALGAGTMLADGTFWSDSHSDLRQENYVVYTPSQRVTPVVTYGETARSLTTVLSAAKELEAQGKRVIAGINGDYYGVAHGIPLGTTMVDGVLRNISCDPYYAVGFRADGTALIGDPQLTIRATVNGADGFDVYSFNHVRQSDYGVFLYDHNFNSRHTTGTSESGLDVLCSVEGGSLNIGGSLVLRVVEVLDDTTDTEVPEGMFVFSVNHKAAEAYVAPVAALHPGDQIIVTVTSQSDSAWDESINLIGAPELLVKDGTVQSGLPTGSAPRTAIGQKADGSLVFYTIDGRKAGYSIGATLTAVAMRLVELGCVTAVALDGGGSTTLVATMPHETSARVMNRPSEGSDRAVSNHVFLVAPNTPSGRLDHIYLAPEATRAVPNARIALTAAAIDTNGIPMNAAVSLRVGNHKISDSTITLPDTVGKVTVTANYNGKTAAAEIEVAMPSGISVKRGGTAIQALTIAPGSAVSLTAEGVLNHLALAGDNSCFTWSFDGNGITASDDGATLTAGSGAGAGILTVSLGDKAASIPVTVSTVPLKTLEGFEAAFEPISSEDSAVTLSRSADAGHVKFGKGSGRLDYTLDDGASATVPVSYALGADYNCVELWAYGSGNGITLTLETDAGSAAPVSIGFTGMRPLSVALPVGATELTGVTVGMADAASGSLWLDQLVLAYDNIVDAVAPEISLTYDAEISAVTAHVFDAINGTTLPTLRLAYDGKAVEHSFSAQTGALTASLPAYDGHAHYVTLTAGDAAGNLARKSVYIPAASDLAPAFPDLVGHWCNPSADYLMRTGISNGSNGLYKADTDISRQEFATMLYRYLAPAQDFSSVELPFYDTEKIAPWAMDAAHAMYALGIIGGGKDADGHLCYMPQSGITRREAVTMLGRLLGKGYAVGKLSYTDAASIPDWAVEHVAVLSSAGVLSEFVSEAFEPERPLTRGEMASMLLRIN